ncbi:family 1 glycosylhydrolase [Thermoanaerobacterium thermosaccharolyticum]
MEGAYDEDGTIPSIRDTFPKTEGKVYDYNIGDFACDYYLFVRMI